MRTRHWLLAIAVGHLALGIVYAAMTPYRTPGLVLGKEYRDIGAPDEMEHADYVAYVAAGKGLPVLERRPPRITYEAHQAPLYYVLAAGWSEVLHLSDLGTPAAGFWLRALNVSFGCGTAVGAFFIAWWGMGRKDVGLCAAAICAFLPMQCAVSGAISNDPLFIALSTWTVAACARAGARGWTLPWAALIGVLVGTALLTKSSALALLPVVVAAWWVAPDRMKCARLAAVAALLAVLIALPWWIRNVAVYGDPLAQRAFTQAFPPDVHPRLMLTDRYALARWLLLFIQRSALSSVGMFGYTHILLPVGAYVAADLGFGWLAYRWARALRDRNWGGGRSTHIVCGACFLAVFATYVAFNLQYGQPQARYLFPALGPIAVALGIGLADWLKARAWIGCVGLTIGLLAINAFAFAVAPPEFRQNIADYALAHPSGTRRVITPGAASGGRTSPQPTGSRRSRRTAKTWERS